MKIVWARRALTHLVELRAWIARDRPGAAAKTAATILAAVELLSEHPGAGRLGRVSGTRELIVPGTPYVIAYRPRGDRLEILAVFHGHQKWPKQF